MQIKRLVVFELTGVPKGSENVLVKCPVKTQDLLTWTSLTSLWSSFNMSLILMSADLASLLSASLSLARSRAEPLDFERPILNWNKEERKQNISTVIYFHPIKNNDKKARPELKGTAQGCMLRIQNIQQVQQRYHHAPIPQLGTPPVTQGKYVSVHYLQSLLQPGHVPFVGLRNPLHNPHPQP